MQHESHQSTGERGAPSADLVHAVNEAMLAGALTVVQTGACPAGTTAFDRVITQSFEPKSTRPDDPIPPRIGREHQTW